MRKLLYTWVRNLHLYAGLWVSPFVLLFAASVILLNHPSLIPANGPYVRRGAVPVEIPPGFDRAEGSDAVRLARQVMKQAGIDGEIAFIRPRPKQKRVTVTVRQPGRETSLDIDLEKRVAEIGGRENGVRDAINYLHVSPGPHLAAIRGNWFYMRAWSWTADSVVYLLLFISASGVYLWTVLRAARKTGLLLLGAGALSFIGLIYALAY